jgi:RNA-directed DNA polymerase
MRATNKPTEWSECLPDGSRVRRESHARFCERPVVKFHRPTHPFGPHRYKKDGRTYLGASPSKKAVARIKEKVGDHLVPSNTETWAEVRDRLNQILRGWAAYFSYGARTMAYRAVDNYVYQCVRHFLRRRHNVPTRGTRRFSDEVVFRELGVLRLRDVQLNGRS